MSNIKNLTPEAFKIDAQEWCNQIETFISDKFKLSYRDGIVVPISGGLDFQCRSYSLHPCNRKGKGNRLTASRNVWKS